MLPEFTSPLGMIKGTFCAESTENVRTTSATFVAPEAAEWLLEMAPLDVGDAAAVAAFLERTRSAHDFGGALTAGAGAVSSVVAVVAENGSGTVVSVLFAVSDTDGETRDEASLGASVRDAADCLRAAEAGTLGVIGMTGRVGVRAWFDTGAFCEIDVGVAGGSPASDGA